MLWDKQLIWKLSYYMGQARGARKCTARQGMNKHLLCAPSVHSHALCSGSFLCEGWLVMSAGGQSPKHSELLLAMALALQ